MRISDWSSDVCSSDLCQRALDRSPTRQSSLGIRRDQDTWDDISEAREREAHRLRESDYAELKTFDVAKLSPQARPRHRMLALPPARALRNFNWRHPHSSMPPIGTRKDVR